MVLKKESSWRPLVLMNHWIPVNPPPGWRWSQSLQTSLVLSIRRSSENQKMVNELMEDANLGARISVKMYFLRSHLDYFPENCGAKSRVSTSTKILVVWRNYIKVDGVVSFWPTTVGIWRLMCSLFSTSGSPWKDHSSMSSLFCALWSCIISKLEIFCKGSVK